MEIRLEMKDDLDRLVKSLRKSQFCITERISSSMLYGKEPTQEELDKRWKAHCYLAAAQNRLLKLFEKHKEITGEELDTIVIGHQAWKKVPDYDIKGKEALINFCLNEQAKHNKKILEAVKDALYDNYD